MGGSAGGGSFGGGDLFSGLLPGNGGGNGGGGGSVGSWGQTGIGGFFGGTTPGGQKIGNYFDPLDVTGNQARDQYNKSMDVYNTNAAKVQEQMDNRPGFQSTMVNGQLGDAYRMDPAQLGDASHMNYAQGKAGTLDEKELTTNLGKAKNVNADLVDKAAQVKNQSVMKDVNTIKAGSVNADDVNAGKNFTNAQADVNALRSEANAVGPTKAAQAQLGMADRQKMSAMDEIARGRAGQYAQTTDDLAAAGGLEGGARERASRNANRDAMFNRQGARSQDTMSRLGITAGDEQNKAALRQNMPSMAMGLDQYQTGLGNQNSNRNLAADQFNVGTNMQAQQTNASNKLNASMYDSGQNMQAQQFNVGTDQTRQLNNANLGLNQDQYNSQLAMSKAGMFNQQDQQQQQMNQAMSQYNAGNRQQAYGTNAAADNAFAQQQAGLNQQSNQYNANAAAMDNRFGNQYALDAWGQNMGALGAQASAGQMAQNQPQGGLFDRLLGMQS